MHNDTVKITIEVWVRKEDVRKATEHLVKAAVDLPVIAEQVQMSNDSGESR